MLSAVVALALIAGYLAGSEVQILRGLFTIPSLLLPWLAVAVCLFYGHRRWRVTRFDRREEASQPC